MAHMHTLTPGGTYLRARARPVHLWTLFLDTLLPLSHLMPAVVNKCVCVCVCMIQWNLRLPCRSTSSSSPLFNRPIGLSLVLAMFTTHTTTTTTATTTKVLTTSLILLIVGFSRDTSDREQASIIPTSLTIVWTLRSHLALTARLLSSLLQ